MGSIFSLLHLLPLRQVYVSGLDVLKVGNEVMEGLPVDDQAGHTLWVVGHDIGGSLLLSLREKKTLSKMFFAVVSGNVFWGKVKRCVK